MHTSFGIVSAGLGTLAGPAINSQVKGPTGQIIAHALVSGSISAVTGGKFANGAATGAFRVALAVGREQYQAMIPEGDSPYAGSIYVPILASGRVDVYFDWSRFPWLSNEQRVSIQENLMSSAEGVYLENGVNLNINAVEKRSFGVRVIKMAGDFVHRSNEGYRSVVNFRTMTLNAVRLGDAFAHEIGHFLGLRDRYHDRLGAKYSDIDRGYENNLMGGGRQLNLAQIGFIQQNLRTGILPPFVRHD